MRRPIRHTRVNAFTVLELTVVLALLSTLITIISVALNRFNEQLKNSADIHTELNEWFAFRANLWRELYTADSVAYKNSEMFIFHSGTSTGYRATDEMLERRDGTEWTATGMAIEDIAQETKDDGDMITFNFLWKDEIMPLSYLELPGVKETIDRYFEQTNE